MSAPAGTVLHLYITFSPGVTFSLAQYFTQTLCRAKHEVEFMCDLWVAAHVKWCPAQPQPRGINKWVLRLCKTLMCAEIRDRIRMLHWYSTILTDKIVTISANLPDTLMNYLKEIKWTFLFRKNIHQVISSFYENENSRLCFSILTSHVCISQSLRWILYESVSFFIYW